MFQKFYMFNLLSANIFFICMKAAVYAQCHKAANGFDRNPTNSDSGINFYGEIPYTSVSLRPELLFFEPSDCSENYNNGQSTFFNDPDFCCKASEPIQCDYSCPYRKYNGACNNPFIPSLGMSEICYLRLTPAYYQGKGGVRTSVTGDPLPEPRNISIKILKDIQRPTAKATYLFTAHGQIIAHDSTRSLHPSMDCCKPENAKKEECTMAIPVRSDDPFYSQFNKTCINFQRSEQCTLCKTFNRNQKNSATAALDANIVYGVSEEEAKKLRTNDETGRLRSSGRNKGYLLPGGKDKRDPFCPKGQDSNCFLSGDFRVNMHASLTTLQTVYMREHNRLANELKKINPFWGEEKLFQEARKILIAEHQCITYKEYLPILLGPHLLELFDMSVKNDPRGTMYNPKVLLAEFQEHAHVAFRLHTMVPTYIGLPGFEFKNTFSNPSMLRKGYILNLTEGSYQVLSEKYDRWVVTDLSDYSNQQPGVHYGSDLSAVDIQRGRDHGVSPYVEIVKFCSGGTIVISSFGDLYKYSLMSRRNIKLLKSMYNNVKDVDMLLGMLMEHHHPGSLLGPSATCVNAIQFYSLQKGDRFYFDHEGPDATFTPEQRSSLKQCSIARILCDNTKITHITRNPYLQSAYDNPDIPCKEIQKIDLTPWKESVCEADIPLGCSF